MIYFTSDHHFGHTNILTYTNRPYKNVYEMDEDLIQRWNSVVSADDLVYYLGDFSMSPNAIPRVLPRLNGKEKHLLFGNHDKVFKKNPDWTAKYLEWGFSSIQDELYDTFGTDYLFRMNHFPYRGEDRSYTEKYLDRRPLKGDEDYLLCGHVHIHFKTKDNMINVGVDVNNYTPISIQTILDLAATLPQKKD